jgi:hypothetical protein
MSNFSQRRRIREEPGEGFPGASARLPRGGESGEGYLRLPDVPRARLSRRARWIVFFWGMCDLLGVKERSKTRAC